MSPTEAVRRRWYEILADPLTGLNQEFVQQCTERGMPIPVGARDSSDAEPFDFGPNSNNVWQYKGTPELIEDFTGEAPDYPCLFLYGVNALQDTDNRILTGVIYDGSITLEMLAFLAWPFNEPPANNDFERPLDMFEESVLRVTNRTPDLFDPILYKGKLSVVERLPLRRVDFEEFSLSRVGIRFSLRADRYLSF